MSPTAPIGEPLVPDVPPEVIPPEELSTLFAACRGSGFDGRRDLAIVMVFADTGIRIGEMVGLEVGDLNRGLRTLDVSEQGERSCGVPLGDKAMDAVVRYLRSR